MKRGIDEKFFSRLYEWRLNLERKTVSGEYLTGREWSLEFPMINNHYKGVHHTYAYAQIVDSLRSGGGSERGTAKRKPHFYNINGMESGCICLFYVLNCYAPQLN
jgi:carotenoid cleavage dioxygenase-like enzyme